jgi:hypothetical protein
MLGALLCKRRDACHATLTETMRAIDGRVLAQVLGAACLVESEDHRHTPLTMILKQ